MDLPWTINDEKRKRGTIMMKDFGQTRRFDFGFFFSRRSARLRMTT